MEHRKNSRNFEATLTETFFSSVILPYSRPFRRHSFGDIHFFLVSQKSILKNMSHEEVVAAFLRRHALPTQVFQNASSKNVNLIDPHGFSRGFAWVNGQDQCACGGSEPPRTDCKDESHELRYLNDEEAKCLKQNNYGMYSGRLVCFEDLPVFLNFQNWLSSLTAAVAFMSSGTAPLTPLSPTPNATAFLKTVTTPPPKSSSGYFSQLYHSYAQGSKCTHSPEKLKELGDEVAATSAGVSSGNIEAP
jgi:hypothetical protein